MFRNLKNHDSNTARHYTMHTLVCSAHWTLETLKTQINGTRYTVHLEHDSISVD